MKKHLLVIFMSVIGVVTFSQNSISGIVTDSTQVPIPFCAMALLNASDSSLVKGNISNDKGEYKFENIRSGNYCIKFTNVGYKVCFSNVITIDSLSRIELPAQQLKTEGVNLKEVSVAVYKPAVEFKKGMVVMNVEDDILAKGNTVLDLLKRLPGVIIDPQNNITINGVGGARFLIDDRMQEMPAPQVLDMLAAMSADAVSKIELIKNPPARYDAAGTGGLINIVTKRAKVKGYNGNISFGISYMKRLRFGPWASLNYKSNKLSVFTNFSYGNWDGVSDQKQERNLIVNGTNQTINSYGTSESFQRVMWGGGGIEYDVTPKTVLGFYVNTNYNNDHYNTNTRTEIGNGSDFNYSNIDYNVKDKFKMYSPNYNLSLLQKIDTIGGQIKASIGYNNFVEKQYKTNENRFYDVNNIEVATASTYNTTNDRNFKVFSPKIDLNKTFKNKLSLESGVKASFADNYSSTELNYFNQTTGFFAGDTTLYNVYRFKERILAVYSTLSRSWEKFGFSLGLRAEETDINAKDIKTNYAFKRNYAGLFPSGSLDFNLDKKNSISAAYSYRIDRPHYGMMNPVRTFNEQLSYGVGNPEIRPQYTHNISLDYNFNQWLTVSGGLNKTKDFTFWYAYTPNSSKISVDTISNLRDRENYYVSWSIQKRIKWYSFQTYGLLMYRTFRGELMGEDVSSETFNYYANLNQEFYLPKDFKIQIWAGYSSKFKDGPQTYHDRSAIHISVHKAFFDKKLNITLAFHDVLYKDYFSYSTSFSNNNFYWYDRMDTRRVRFTVNYRFGKMRIEQRMNAEGDSRIKSGK